MCIAQLPQRDAEADAVAAADIPVDDHRGDRSPVNAAAMFQFRAKNVVDFDIRRVQPIERIDQADLGMLARLPCQLTRIEQNEFGAIGPGGAHLIDQTRKIAAAPELQSMPRCIGLQLKLPLQFPRQGTAGSVRPMNDQYAHRVMPIIARSSGCNMLLPFAVKVLQGNGVAA